MQHLDYSQQKDWYQADDTPFQSPIAINTSQTLPETKSDLTVKFHDRTQYQDRVVGEQFLVQGELVVNGETWQLERFHFHDGAEHLIDNVRHDAEIHFVYHKNDDTLVLAIFGDVATGANTHIPDIFTGEIDAKLLADLLPPHHDYFHYVGSLTTPPLGENISWLILAEPIALSTVDLAILHDRYPNNYRDIQDVAGREVSSIDIIK
ncbi:carbonic anhydrase family protein [Leuconostoc carnosum]|uniref:carbonic anhydrase n=2 Tax=Leuconostoc carnosum TaxID=1252 RepID=K0DAU0_LEUCJ|nr:MULTISPECIES: carbonic anhydrase family protein [Leuconostoc]AFT81031.1 carbonic anhydrase [Leuconostoc carnosum JB16]KAA8327254.1 carbonic anhydrase family protein [Leuconostoc carnosum]KAA8332396.1 carbonic anhydrase family protein [Leuconostoc carnosum]KAA8364343.1 carbonic anhydrase family protein [Leuconostoc carnosum]KAA8367235.1 carbonic anhydrase family protein [Leuconostoc carnosum]